MDPTMTDDLTNLELGNVLFEKAMKGKWGEVVDICTENPWSLVAGITRLEDTLLHLAVSSGQEETVRKLTSIIVEQPNHEMLLRVKNERENTALHIAALMGNEAMCKCIASVDNTLIGERNHEGETPLFTAVLFGKQQAFQCLYDLCPSDARYSCSRNTHTGDTILHCAISGDHFDLALRIIELYKEVLVNAVNENGITPLHLLAEKPSAFPSGSRLGVFERMIYHGIYVDEHKTVMEQDDHSFQRSMQPIERLPAHSYPENYRTCNDFYRLFWNFFTFLRLAMGINVGAQTDEENPQTHAGNQETKATSTEAWNRRFFPANYEVCCNFLKLANRIVLIVLGGGIPTIKKIYKEKRQHIMSIQIMNKLLKGVKMSEFYHAGKKPSLQSDKAKLDTSRKEDQETNPLDAIDAHDSEAENREEGVAGIISGGTGTKHEASSQQTNSTGGNNKDQSVGDGKKIMTKNETVILIAARNGVAEIVEKILELVPVAIHDVNEDNKNAFVTTSIPSNFVPRYNKRGKTPEDVFIKTHKNLVKKGGEWLTNTSQSYSLVAALIATVAFATSTTVPGGVKEDTGIPTLENRPAFHLFAISSLVALCFSVTALVMFLSILTSRHQERDFGKDLPRKLLIGLTSLFVSIAAVLISFCSGHFFVVQNKLKYVAFAVYAATCLPVTFFAAVQFPLYFDLIHATFTKVPRRSYKATL
ncbi:hypothetical protein CIPAW_08G151200 [Carya illinoinensis]|uniref:PGG domain-containing protein n=1 Tax=Carya illinoinensis TaxID=32201 RepID=A0A8T1PVH9_CARIL|nr:hypothetical protein CIPAW_08G151200 [Carya illinoinensis]